jgi:hypothetical protein
MMTAAVAFHVGGTPALQGRLYTVARGRHHAAMTNKRQTPPRGKSPGAAAPLQGREAYIARLRAGETVSFREGGNSMHPRIKHRQKCTYAPVTALSELKVGDAVFCKVGPHYYTHLVKALEGERVLIGNNHGKINGWTTLERVFGRVVAVED